MTDQGSSFDSFMPHGMSYQWRPSVLWLKLTRDLVTALTFFAIPMILLYLARQRQNTWFLPVIFLFSLFLFACGITNAISIWTVWHDDYGLQGLFKTFTAFASLVAAFVLVFIAAKIVYVRSFQELQTTYGALIHPMVRKTGSEKQATQIRAGLAYQSRVDTVSDSGAGVPPNMDPFEPFESEKESGMGIGLSISREIIEFHGGKMDYDRTRSRGASFHFTIPRIKSFTLPCPDSLVINNA